MSTGLRWTKFIGALLLGASVLCAGSFSLANDRPTHSQRKTKKAPPRAPLPSGPTGPVQQIPLDSMAAVPPQVNYQNNQLTIVAPNSTLAEILRAVRKQTGADIEIPVAPERVVTRLGPGPAREVVAELLNGSRFNYVLLGSAADQAQLTRVVLVAKSGPEPTPITNQTNPAITQASGMPPPDQEIQPDPNDTQAAEEDTPDENPDQAAAEGEQPAITPDQAGVKTPQQLLQEMQQRQMQMQQQQPAGQPPIPGSGMPPHPPPDQPQQQ
jgi:hypothetical protein